MSVPRSGSLWVGCVSDMALNRQFTCWQNSGMSLLFVRKRKSDRKELYGLWNTLGENPPHPSWAQWNLELTEEDGRDRPIHSLLLILLAPGCPGPAADAGRDLLLEEPEHGAQVRGGGTRGRAGSPQGSSFSSQISVSSLESVEPACVHVCTCVRAREACGAFFSS